MKKHMIRMALAGALAFGVASVSKAADEATSPVWSGLAQETLVQKFATVAGTTTGLEAGLQNVRLQGVFKAGAADTLTIGSSFAIQNVNGFTLLDAYDVHSLSNINDGLALKIGQFKVAFGQDGYSSPDQLIRANYSVVDKLVPGFILNEGNAWLVGAELDQTYSDLTIQVAAVEPVTPAYATITNGTKFDYVGRAQWKGSNIALGLSDYVSSTNANLTLNTLGANGSLSVDVYKLDLEAIFGNAGFNGYTGTLSAKYSDLTPAVWYEWGTTSAGANVNTVGATDLGAGLAWAVTSNHRIALNVDFTGPNNGDILSVNAETLQFSQTF